LSRVRVTSRDVSPIKDERHAWMSGLLTQTLLSERPEIRGELVCYTDPETGNYVAAWQIGWPGQRYLLTLQPDEEGETVDGR
jgi:hypothetical protein